MNVKNIAELANTFFKLAQAQNIKVQYGGETDRAIVENIAAPLIKKIVTDHAKNNPGNTYYGSVDFVLNPDQKNPKIFGLLNSTAKINININNEYDDPDALLSDKVKSLNPVVLKALVNNFNRYLLEEGEVRKPTSKDKMVFLQLSFQ